MQNSIINSIDFMYSKDTDEGRLTHSNSDNVEIIIYDKAYEVIKERFESLLSRYLIGLKKSMKGSDFIFVLTFCFANAINKYKSLWIICRFSRLNKNQKAITKTINDDICIQYATIFALIHKEIRKSLQRIYYTWKRMK